MPSTTGWPSPDPALFAVALREAGGRAVAEMVHVGDSLEFDVAGARNAGVFAVWLNRDGRGRDGEPAPDAEIQTLDELLPILEQLGEAGPADAARRAPRGGCGVRRRAGRPAEPQANLEPDSAAFLRLLLLSNELRSVLEIGTSNGYSTIWFSEAVSHTGGRVVSVDTDADALAQARGRTSSAPGSRARPSCAWPTAATPCARCPRGSVDLLFLDAERTEYAGWWPHPVPGAPRRAACMVVDNVLSHPDEVAGFQALIEADLGLWSVVVPTGKGLSAATAEPT